MTDVKGILVPTDFTETSDAAVKYAIDMAQALGGQLYLLHVPGETGENFEANFPVGRFVTAARERLGLSPEAIGRLRPEYALRIGTPAVEIVRYAEDRDVDLIVMGTHGRTGVAHLLMGSVAEHVIRTAPCSVLLVRHPKHAFFRSQAVSAAEVAATSAPSPV